ncbi:MAG: hypothetical protein IKE34_10860 [Paenibacillus sp.]|nr:hypothetical protein [Paenibacillus sp.]
MKKNQSFTIHYHQGTKDPKELLDSLARTIVKRAVHEAKAVRGVKGTAK